MDALQFTTTTKDIIKPSDIAMKYGREALGTESQRNKQIQEQAHRDNYSRQIFRRWQPGDVYAPKDLSGPEQKKWKNARRTAGIDAFDTLGINPINEYKVGIAWMARRTLT